MFDQKLALAGGKPVFSKNYKFKPNNTIGREEKKSVRRVLDSGVLSKYIGAWHPDFLGGPRVRQLESEWADYFKVKHAIAVNSWTSGLIAAVGAIGIEPGDEVIVTPWTMSATATSILLWGGIPVFADIDPETFCIDPDSVRSLITPKTKAIMSVDIFGQSADMQQLRLIASEFDLKIISDSAQSPGAMIGTAFAGTLADIGGYSLNYHKHIHSGEGGVLVTNDDNLADRLRLIRNHAESVVGAAKVHDISNMVGFNFRMGEIEAAIASAQLKKLQRFVSKKVTIANILRKELSDLPALFLPKISEGNTHVYYVFAMRYTPIGTMPPREKIIEALKMEGVPSIYSSYQNLHLLPMFQQKIAIGSKGFPWISSSNGMDINYKKGICPQAEALQDSYYIGINICEYDFSEKEAYNIARAFKKIWSSSLFSGN